MEIYEGIDTVDGTDVYRGKLQVWPSDFEDVDLLNAVLENASKERALSLLERLHMRKLGRVVMKALGAMNNSVNIQFSNMLFEGNKGERVIQAIEMYAYKIEQSETATLPEIIMADRANGVMQVIYPEYIGEYSEEN
jgi:hypothetical protein